MGNWNRSCTGAAANVQPGGLSVPLSSGMSAWLRGRQEAQGAEETQSLPGWWAPTALAFTEIYLGNEGCRLS